MNQLTLTAEPDMPIITSQRAFDAPRAKVFDAFINKSTLEKWWLGPGYDVRIDTVEPVDGGRWHFTQFKGDEQFTFHGNFHEVTTPERIIWTFEFEPLPERGHISMEKVEFAEDGPDRTIVTSTMVFFSVADRDGMVQSGMEGGLKNSYDNLEQTLQEDK